MTPEEYIKKALRTEIRDYKFKATGEATPRLEHSIFGLATEAGELITALKRCKIYGDERELDKVSLIEELGDIMWYLAILADELGVTFEQLWNKNIRKLQVRLPEKYTDHNAQERDTDREREEIEK